MNVETVVISLVLLGLCEFSLSQIYSLDAFQAYVDEPETIDEICTTKRVTCPFGATIPNIDGTCNNLNNPTRGATDTVMPRLLHSEYYDGIGHPRVYGKYRMLHSSRKVSTTMKIKGRAVSSGVSHLHVLFGQLLAHDIVHTPVVKKPDGKKLDCNCQNPDPDCINIQIPLDDEQHVQDRKMCFGLARSKAAKGYGGCIFPHREQTNTMSSVIDGTFLYGKSDAEARDVRDPHSLSGEIKLVDNPASPHHKNLPNQNELRHTDLAKTIDCDVKVHKPTKIPCFVSGDVRVNENPGLVAIQTIWARYHNFVARGLKSVNPHWNSDKVFNIARRIMSALMQSITYREFVPLLLGPIWTKRFGLNMANQGFWNGYDERYNPAITNEFTTAAFRYGHSMVTESLSRPTTFFSTGSIDDVTSFDTFFSSEPFLDPRGGGSGALMRGFMFDNADKSDESLTNALHNHLFTEIGKNYGRDLYAINIQRGRDHGLPGYNKYRELCGLPRVRSFAELTNEIPTAVIHKLQKAYDHVDDIDLYVGGLSETLVEGGEVGPTFACILGYGLRGLRRGDRFWHELKHSPSPFTSEQLKSIRKTTQARMICDTGENMKYVIKYPLAMKGGRRGSFIECGNLPGLDLSLWSEFRHHAYSSAKITNTEWTKWFVTSETAEWRVDSESERHRLATDRPDEVCNNHENFERRRVSGDTFIQIRFACPPGTIKATDFPFQLSQDYKWSEWIQSQHVPANQFSCQGIVAIQAITTDGKKFASETGDVFESYDTNGFSCRDHQQIRGYCSRYKVRALCSASVIQPHPIARPTTATTTTTTTNFNIGLPSDLQETINAYCQHYGICCSGSATVYTIFSPTSIVDHARLLCRQHGVCCD